MPAYKIDLSTYHNTLGRRHQLLRIIWSIVWSVFARPLPRSAGRRWKVLLLRIFGAQIASSANVYSSAKIYYPPYLVMDEYSCIDANVNCYNVAPVHIGANSTVSQGAFLCTASHDIANRANPLITAPIIIEDQAWIAADAFIGMGVTVCSGAVVGARAAVFKNVAPWTVVGGNPAKEIKIRIIKK